MCVASVSLLFVSGKPLSALGDIVEGNRDADRVTIGYEVNPSPDVTLSGPFLWLCSTCTWALGEQWNVRSLC